MATCRINRHFHSISSFARLGTALHPAAFTKANSMGKHKRKPRQVEKSPVFKSRAPNWELLVERHGIELAREMMDVRSDVEFRKFCERHGIEQGGKSTSEVATFEKPLGIVYHQHGY